MEFLKCKGFGGKHFHKKLHKYSSSNVMEEPQMELEGRWKDHHHMEHRKFDKMIHHGHHKMHRKFQKGKHGHHKCHKMSFNHHNMRHGHHNFGKMARKHHLHHRMQKLRIQFQEKSEDEEMEGGQNLNASKSKARITTENGQLQIYLDVSLYQPNEITVEIMDGKILVSAAHICTEDDLYESHEMRRSFDIPTDVGPESISSRIDSDGKLVIEAPIVPSNEREIPVVRLDE